VYTLGLCCKERNPFLTVQFGRWFIVAGNQHSVLTVLWEPSQVAMSSTQSDMQEDRSTALTNLLIISNKVNLKLVPGALNYLVGMCRRDFAETNTEVMIRKEV
jgi:hypothetical protein